MSGRMLDPGRDRKLGGEMQAMCRQSIDTNAASGAESFRGNETTTGVPTRFEPSKLFDAVTLSMPMMFLGQTLLIVALVRL